MKSFAGNFAKKFADVKCKALKPATAAAFRETTAITRFNPTESVNLPSEVSLFQNSKKPVPGGPINR